MGKENATKDMQIRIPPSLHERFKKICDKQYKTVAASIKELMLRFVE